MQHPANNVLTHQREKIVAKVFRELNMQDKLKERWEKINYRPPVPVQLNLFATAEPQPENATTQRKR